MGGTGGANTITDEESLRYRTEGFRFAFVAAHLPAFSFCSDVDGHHLRVPVVHCDCHAGSDQLSLAGRTLRRGPHAPHRLRVGCLLPPGYRREFLFWRDRARTGNSESSVRA